MLRKFTIVATLFLSGTAVLAKDIPTRYGMLKIDDENMLLYKNRPLSPEVQGNRGLSVVGVYKAASSDFVLVQDDGGSGCPALLYFVTVSGAGAKATPAFGTCSDLIEVKPAADSVTVTMPGFKGGFESKSAQAKAAKEKHVYVFQGGVVTQNGKPLK